jgi:hypothetical protein
MKIYSVISAVLVAVVGALGAEKVIDPGMAAAVATVIAAVIAQVAHNATPPAPKA